MPLDSGFFKLNLHLCRIRDDPTAACECSRWLYLVGRWRPLPDVITVTTGVMHVPRLQLQTKLSAPFVWLTCFHKRFTSLNVKAFRRLQQSQITSKKGGAVDTRNKQINAVQGSTWHLKWHFILSELCVCPCSWKADVGYMISKLMLYLYLFFFVSE